MRCSLLPCHRGSGGFRVRSRGGGGILCPLPKSAVHPPLSASPLSSLLSSSRCFSSTPRRCSPAKKSAAVQGGVTGNGTKTARGVAGGGPSRGRPSTTSSSSAAAPLPLGPDGRRWATIEGWCSLCREPVNSWNNHRGKRDHICLQLFYNALVRRTDRRWQPRAVWADVEADAELCLSGGRIRSRRALSRHRRRQAARGPHLATPVVAADGVLVNAYGERMCVAPPGGAGGASPPHYSPAGNLYMNPMTVLQHALDKDDPQSRRANLLLLLRALTDAGVLTLTPSNLHHASFEGSIVLFRELFTPLSGMFPHADAAGISALTQSVAATYCSETVFDLCRLDAVVPREIAESRSTITATGPLSAEEESMTMDGEWFGDDDGADATTATPSTTTAPSAACGASNYPFYFKGVFCRAILGALRWALEPDNVLPPPALQRRGVLERATPCGGGSGPGDYGYYGVLAAHCCRLLIAEAVHCRVSEYVVRVEGVVRDEGFGLADLDAIAPAAGTTRRKQQLAVSRRDHLVPPLTNHGMLQYMEGGRFFYHNFSPKNRKR